MRKLLICMLLSLWGFVSIAHAEELRMATVDQWPYGGLVAGKPAGIAWDALHKLARKLDMTPVTLLLPLDQTKHAVLSGEVQLAVLPADGQTDSALENLGVACVVEYVAFGRRGSAFRSLRELRGKRVAFVRNDGLSSEELKLQKYVPHTTESYEEAVQLLMARKVDAVAGESTVLMAAVESVGIPAHALDSPFELSETTACVFTSADTLPSALRKKITKILTHESEQ